MTFLCQLFFQAVSVGDCASDHELFPEFLRRLSAQKQREASAGDAAPAASSNPVEVALREECLHSMSQCLANNPAAVRHWQQMYASHLAASADLLAYLGETKSLHVAMFSILNEDKISDSNWKKLKSSLVRNEDLMDTLDAFEDYNEGASGQKDGLSLATSSTKVRTRHLVSMSHIPFPSGLHADVECRVWGSHWAREDRAHLGGTRGSLGVWGWEVVSYTARGRE